MAITNASITQSPSVVYNSQGNNAITTLIVCNTAIFNPANPTENQTYLYLYVVPSGESTSPPSAETMIVNKLLVPAGESVLFDREKIVFEDGDKIVASSESPANLVITISTLAV